MWDSMERAQVEALSCAWLGRPGVEQAQTCTWACPMFGTVAEYCRMFTMLHRYERWEWKKERGKLVTGIVYHREYRVVYLNTLACSAYSQVGQSAKSPKLHLHHTSCTHAFPVVWCSQQLQRVPEHLNRLSSWNRGRTLLVSGAH